MRPIMRPAKTSLRGAAAPASADAPRVSVVIPTYNRAGLVGRAIATVLAQTFADFELIVVDDASKEDTAAVVANISDPRLRFIRLATNGGVSRARNAGIAVARGEWVAFLDDDDEWLPRKLEAQLARVDADGDARTGDVYCLRLGGTPEGIVPSAYVPPLPEGDVLDALLDSALPIGPSMHMVRRSALLEVGGFDESLWAVEDRDLWLRLTQAQYRFLAVAETLTIKHSDHKGQLSEDALVMLRSFAAFRRRWGRLSRSRRDPAEYAATQAVFRKMFERLHRKQVKRLARKWRRGRAWHYAVSVGRELRTFPWLAPFVAKAVAVALLGRRAERFVTGDRRDESKADRLLRAERSMDDTT